MTLTFRSLAEEDYVPEPPPLVRLISNKALEDESLSSDVAAIARPLISNGQLANWMGVEFRGFTEATYQFSGLGSISNLFRGCFQFYYATGHLSEARENDNRDDAIAAGLDAGSSLFQTLFGFAQIGVKSTGVAAVFFPHNAALIAAAATAGLLTGSVAIPMLVLGLCWIIFQANRARNFYKAYENSSKSFDFLIDSIFISPARIRAYINAPNNDLEATGKRAFSKSITATPLDTLLQQHFPSLLAIKRHYFPQVQDLIEGLTFYEKLGLLVQLQKEQARNEATVSHAFGANNLNKIKMAVQRGLQERLNVPYDSVKAHAAADHKDLCNEFEAHYHFHRRKYLAIGILSLMGIGLSVLSFFTLGTPIILSTLGIGVALSFCSMGLDLFAFKSDGEERPGRLDKPFIALCATLVSLGMVGTLISFFLLHGSLGILFFSLTIGSLALFIYACGYYKLICMQRAYKYKHPEKEDLRSYLTKLQTQHIEQLDQEALRLFKHLPPRARKSITHRASQRSFATSRYSGWDEGGQFAHNCLTNYFLKQLQIDEVEKLRRAVKKTSKYFWNMYWNGDPNAGVVRGKVLQLEQLFESLVNEDQSAAQEAYNALTQEAHSPFVAALHAHICHIFKREESVELLLSVL